MKRAPYTYVLTPDERREVGILRLSAIAREPGAPTMQEIMDRFGVSRGTVLACVHRLPKEMLAEFRRPGSNRIARSPVKAVAAMFAADASNKEVAARFGWSESHARQMRSRLGYGERASQVALRKKRAVAMLRAGRPLAYVAGALGVSERRVWQIRKELREGRAA